MILYSHSAEETERLGKELGSQLPDQVVICFFGDLAAGKTTFIKGLVAGAAGIDPLHVHSPTFTYLHIYQGSRVVYHFDLYRLRDINEFLSMGFDEYLDKEGICCIEWSEKIQEHLPPGCMHIHLYHAGGDQREIHILQQDH